LILFEVDRIFVGLEPHLYAVKWKGEEKDCLQETFAKWRDVEYLEEFFETHKGLLNSGIWSEMTVERAVEFTITEAEAFWLELLEAAEAKKPEEVRRKLQNLFVPLSENTIVKIQGAISFDPRRKAYGTSYPSWLRLYAVEIQPAVFVLTGGAIKLTKKMQDFPETMIQLMRLEKCLSMFKENYIEDFDSLCVFINEN